jgi:hypothetical protein
VKLVPRSPIPNTSVRNAPTLWPPQPNDWKPIEFAVRLSEQENSALKNLVVSLSEIILKDIIGSQRRWRGRNSGSSGTEAEFYSLHRCL